MATATVITNKKMKVMIESLDTQWKKKLVEDIFLNWQDRAVIEKTPSKKMFRFTAKKGGKFFAILFPYQTGKLKLSISDYLELIHLSSLPLEKTGKKQFEKSQYGERIAFIESEKQCESVKDAIEMAYRLKIKNIS